MEEKINEIKNLSNEEVLALHAAVEEHIKYLNENILTLEEETPPVEGGEENE